MKKKTFNIMILISIAVVIFGLLLIWSGKTPYEICKIYVDSFGNDFVTYSEFNYGVDNIKRYAALYFSGITLTILGGISFFTGIIGKAITQKEKRYQAIQRII